MSYNIYFEYYNYDTITISCSYLLKNDGGDPKSE